MTMQKFASLAFTLILTGILASCSSFHFPGVYKIEIAQGNKIDERQLKKLQPGMTQKQVIYLLGSPLLQDPLQPDRWDYYYDIKPSGHGKHEVKHLVVHFKGDQFSHYELK